MQVTASARVDVFRSRQSIDRTDKNANNVAKKNSQPRLALGSASNLIPARIAAPDKCDEDAKGYTKRGIVFESLLGRESEGRRTPAALMWVSITLAKQSIFQ